MADVNLQNRPATTVDEGDIARQLFDGMIGEELGLSPENLSTTLGVAKLKLQSGDAQTALKLYTALVLCSPANIDFQCGLANCALQLQEYALVLHAASAMVGLDPSDCRGYYFSAASCIGLRYYAEAAEDIDDAIKFAELSRNADFLLESKKLQSQLAALKS